MGKIKPDIISPLFIVVLNFGLGGVQTKIVDIVNDSGRLRPNLPIYIILRRRESFDLSRKITNEKVKIINYGAWVRVRIPLFFNIFLLYQAWRLRPRYILSFLTPYSFSAVLVKLFFFWRKIRLVISEDCFSSGVIPLASNARLYTLGIRWLYPLADTIVAVTLATKNDLVKTYGLPDEKIKIIYNWTSIGNKSSGKNKPLEKIYDLIYVGRLAKTKGLNFLLEGLAKMKKKRRKIKLCLVGDGEERRKLEDLARSWGITESVEFVGEKYDVKDYIKHAKIFVYSSQFEAEGFPIAILEAMALGIPILSRRFSGLEEVIQDEINGSVFDSLEGFVDKSLRLLESPERQELLAQRAKIDIRKYYSKANIKDYLVALGV